VGSTDPDPTPNQLALLIELVGSGADKKAFAALFAFYAPRLKSFLSRQGFGSTECEDLVQEAMLNVWRKAFTFDRNKAGASTWVYTIARNVGIDRRRQDGRIRSWEALTSFEDVDPDPSAEVVIVTAESEERVRAALRALPPEQAAVINMTFYGETTQVEIAQKLGIPLGTVKSRARLALTRLRKAMDGEL
jgi:RNA polymerase sigma-70 factor (ECF subfamily)